MWVLATELVMGSGRSTASLGYGYYGICIKIMPKTGAIVDLSVDPADSCSPLPIAISSGPGPIPLTFCLPTGKINGNLLADVLLTETNPGLVIFRPYTCMLSSLSPALIYIPYL
ncbi:MAG: hypothetical protein QGH37_33020 [Candidatus Poribacteria bacterium]|nr:hypothetical protein [Candidatus Poribacteria bacterium]